MPRSEFIWPEHLAQPKGKYFGSVTRALAKVKGSGAGGVEPHGFGAWEGAGFGFESVRGEFKRGAPHGWCTTSPAASSAGAGAGAGEAYVGEFKDGRRHGYGTATAADGQVRPAPAVMLSRVTYLAETCP